MLVKQQLTHESTMTLWLYVFKIFSLINTHSSYKVKNLYRMYQIIKTKNHLFAGLLDQ